MGWDPRRDKHKETKNSGSHSSAGNGYSLGSEGQYRSTAAKKAAAKKAAAKTTVAKPSETVTGSGNVINGSHKTDIAYIQSYLNNVGIEGREVVNFDTNDYDVQYTGQDGMPYV